ncbi:MAG: pteridine-dependent deoxygenase [Halioglobus sp.]
MSPTTADPEHGASVTCSYRTEAAEQLLKDEQALAVVSFGAHSGPGDDPRHIYCGLPQLGGEPVTEVWRTTGVVHRGEENGCHWAQSEDSLFVALWIEDGGDALSLRDEVMRSYRQLLALIQQRGFPRIVRAWNYIADINAGAGDMERYRQFCAGRQTAFSDWHYSNETYPAASALGHRCDKTAVYLLAGKHAARPIENPRQVSAYHYPREYGPASPSFARAALMDCGANQLLHISGTASVVGHESQHEGDLAAQLQTTFSNLDALFERSSEYTTLGTRPAADLLKVYVRREEDYETVRQAVCARFPHAQSIFLRADICRRELLVEIDGVGVLSETRPHQNFGSTAVNE